MRKLLLVALTVFVTIQLSGQTTVNRKIAQRADEYIANAWQGKDSIIFQYNAFGHETFRFATEFQNTNWINNFRYTSTYDAQGNLTLRTYQYWINNTWQNGNQYSCTYNANQQVLETLYQTWSVGTNSWTNAGRIVQTYNAAGLLTKLENFVWNGSWQPGSRQDYTYNSSNKLIVKEAYNYINNAWEGVLRQQFLYAFGFVSQITESVWDNGNWILSTQNVRLINGSATPARLEQETTFYRDASNQNWVFNQRVKYNYTNNLLTAIESEKYDSTAQAWYNLSLRSNTYNGNAQLIEEILQQYNPATNFYENDARRVLTYNGNNLNDQITYYDNAGANSWVETKREQLSYNQQDSLIYRLSENYVSNTFVPSEQFFFYYQDIPVGLTNYEHVDFVTLYPNPAVDKISLTLPEKMEAFALSIYNLEGKRLWQRVQTSNTNDATIDIASLSSGHYILQLTNLQSGNVRHFKLTKQ